jgi:hypothetical protein
MKRPRGYSLLLVCSLSAIVDVAVNAGSFKSHPYLYTPLDEKGNYQWNASWPVRDHIAPAAGNAANRPDFLYRDRGYRIVEFYVHWCNICIGFAPRFVRFARQVRSLAASEAGVDISIHAVSCTPNRQLCKAAGMPHYPAVRLLRPGDALTGIDLRKEEVRPIKVLEKLGIQLSRDIEEDDEEEEEKVWDVTTPAVEGEDDKMRSWFNQLLTWQNSRGVIAAQRQGYHRRTRDELRRDVHLSFDFAMRNGVFPTDDPLSKEASRALMGWLKLLDKTLPDAWTVMRTLVKRMLTKFRYIVRNEDYLLIVLDQFPPVSDEWSAACSKGNPGSGYTCGLWEMFHTVTVGAVDYNRGTVSDKNLLKTEQVARAIRDYVDHFFGCEVCRANFLKMFDVCGFNRCERLNMEQQKDNQTAWYELPLWLFETHNAVNLRLLRESAERTHRDVTKEDEIAVEYPPRIECSACWLGDGTYNKTVARQFLQYEYGQRDRVEPAVFHTEEALARAAEERALEAPSDPHVGGAPVHNSTPLQISHSFIVVLGILVLFYAAGSRRRRKLRTCEVRKSRKLG